MKSILDRSFKYVPSHATDIRRTFERARQKHEVRVEVLPASSNNVTPLSQMRKAAQH
jgi:hypothetical protein